MKNKIIPNQINAFLEQESSLIRRMAMILMRKTSNKIHLDAKCITKCTEDEIKKCIHDETQDCNFLHIDEVINIKESSDMSIDERNKHCNDDKL